jgi:hypothetical protein
LKKRQRDGQEDGEEDVSRYWMSFKKEKVVETER